MRLIALVACLAVGLLVGGFASAQPLDLLGFTRPPAAVVGIPKAHPAPRQVRLGKYPARTIVINTSERKLYLVLPGGGVRTYPIGVGRDGFTGAGTTVIGDKKEWPEWTPPAAMLKREPHLPRHMAGGPNNPLGARALYLHWPNGRGDTQYRIHGSNNARSIGFAMSSGCFRMLNEDVIDLHRRVAVGATVVVLR